MPPLVQMFLVSSRSVHDYSAFAPGLKVSGPLGAIVTVVGLAVLNTTLWSPDLFFALPTELSYRALITLVLNGVIFWVFVKVMPGVEIEGLSAAFIAPLIFSVLTVLVARYGSGIDWENVAKKAAAGVEHVRDELEKSNAAAQH